MNRIQVNHPDEDGEENIDENSRLLNSAREDHGLEEERLEPISSRERKLPFHFFILKFTIILDLAVGILMYILYLSLVPSTNRSDSGLQWMDHLIPLDILILCLIRCYLLFYFISSPLSKTYTGAVIAESQSFSFRYPCLAIFKKHIPVWTCFISLFYLLIRTMFASTTLAYLTLTSAFVFSWTEMLIYVYSIISIGPNCWIDVEDNLAIPNGEENSVHIDSIEFEFPESPSYEIYNNRIHKSPIQYPSSNHLNHGSNEDVNDDLVTMGTSAPISIIIPSKNSMNRTSIDQHHFQRYSKSLAYNHSYNHTGPSDSTMVEICKLYLARHGDLHRICKALSSIPVLSPEEHGKQQFNSYNDAQNLLKKHGRHQILPRYAILHAEIEMIFGYPVNGYDLESSYHMLLTTMSSCKEVCLTMLKLGDVQALSIALSDPTSPALFRMAHGSVNNSTLTDSLDFNNDTTADLTSISGKLDLLFWVYWRLDVECVLAKTHLITGLLHFISGRHVKGSVSLAKAHSILNNIGQKLTLYSNQKNCNIGGNNGKFGEALYNLKNSIQETHSLILSSLFIIPSIAPNLQDTYLKPLSIPDDKWKGIRNLYQLTLKHSLESFTSSLFLLFILQVSQMEFFSFSYPAEYREISTMLSVLETSFTRHIPLFRFLVFKVHRRHGSAFAKLQDISLLVEGVNPDNGIPPLSASVVPSSSLHLAVRIEIAVTKMLQLDWGAATAHLDSIWLIILERNRSKLTSSLDLEAGLLYIGLKKYFELLSREIGSIETVPNSSNQKQTLLKIGNDASGKAAHFFHINIVPSLLEKFASNGTRQSRHTKTLVYLVNMSGNEPIEVFLLFLSLYYRGDISVIARSKSNQSIMINLALKLDSDFRDLESVSIFSKLVHALIVGTLLKYLSLHNAELLNYFAELYPGCKTMAEVSKCIYQSCLQDQVSDWIQNIGLMNHIQFELAELEALCFENYEKSLELLNSCMSKSKFLVDLSKINDGDADNFKRKKLFDQDQNDKFPPSPFSLPSFLRKSQKGNNYQRMRNSISMGSPDVLSSISSSMYNDTIENSKLMMGESIGFESSLLGFGDFDLKCKNSSRAILEKLGHS